MFIQQTHKHKVKVIVALKIVIQVESIVLRVNEKPDPHFQMNRFQLYNQIVKVST